MEGEEEVQIFEWKINKKNKVTMVKSYIQSTLKKEAYANEI